MRQEIADLHAAIALIRAEVALKLMLGDKQKAHFHKMMNFAEWLATGWEYIQKVAVVVGVVAGIATAIWGRTWFGK